VLLNRGDGSAMADSGSSFSIEHYIMLMASWVLNDVHHMHGIDGSQGILDFSI